MLPSKMNGKGSSKSESKMPLKMEEKVMARMDKKMAKKMEEVNMPLKKTKKASAKVETTPQPAASDSYVILDYPQSGELVSSSHYAVKIGASSDGAVQLSLNGGEWLSCRNSAGYWWYDLYQMPLGSNKITVRLVDGQGNVIKKTSIRKFEVI